MIYLASYAAGAAFTLFVLLMGVTPGSLPITKLDAGVFVVGVALWPLTCAAALVVFVFRWVPR